MTQLQLNQFDINEDYRKFWNVHEQDFVFLAKDNIPLRETLYRVGGLGGKEDMKKGGYFLLLKHVEAYYSNDITKETKRQPHLEARWCIIDKDGNEKIELPKFKSPYLIRDSIIYNVDRDYYNIETKELYCSSYNRLESEDFLFLDNKYSKDLTRCGVMKINKKDGSWELFK